MKITLVHSAKAGMQEHTKKALLTVLKDLGFAVTYCSIKDADLEAKLLAPAEFVVAAGGDGTVGRVAKAIGDLSDRSPPMTVLPLGTANNIATSLGIKGSIEDIASGWASAQLREVSLGEAKAHWGRRLFIEGVGLGSLACATAPTGEGKEDRGERIRRGRIAFRDAVIDTEPERLYVTVDGKLIEEEVILVEIMNIGYAGPSLHLAPDANAEDGILDVAYVPSNQRMPFLAWLNVLIDQDFDSKESLPRAPISIVQGEKIVVAWNGITLRVDDDFPMMPGDTTAPASAEASTGRADMLSIELAARKLAILMPARNGAETPEGR